jgi:hypothetical protein
MRATEDKARRRLAAASRGGGAPERTSADAEGTCTGSSSEDTGSCTVTMDEAHELVATLE